MYAIYKNECVFFLLLTIVMMRYNMMNDPSMRDHAKQFPDGGIAVEIRREIAHRWTTKRLMDKLSIDRSDRRKLHHLGTYHRAFLNLGLASYIDLSLADNTPQERISINKIKRTVYDIHFNITVPKDMLKLFRNTRHITTALVLIDCSTSTNNEKINLLINIYEDASAEAWRIRQGARSSGGGNSSSGMGSMAAAGCM
jgi:hypothetical protein